MKETILNALNFRYATKIFDKEKQLEEEKRRTAKNEME